MDMLSSKKIKIMIDAGHGGKDRANRGPTGYIEADGTLEISKLLREELLAIGVFEVKLTREVDMTLGLTERGQMAIDWGADVFIAEHTNACNTLLRGTEVYYSVDIPDDKVFASYLSDYISTTLGIPNRGPKTRESVKYKGEDFYTVIDTAQDGGVPHVFIVESAFHDNVEDEKILKQHDNLVKIAKSQVAAICKFFGINNTPIVAPKYYKYTNNIIISNLATIRKGSKGSVVKFLQNTLKEAGFDCGAVDGIFGSKTLDAVTHYQSNCGLVVDGIVGPNTWRDFLEVDVVELDKRSLKAAMVSTGSSSIAKTYPNFINANFFSGRSVIGWLVSEGNILSRRDEYKVWKGHPKGTFIVYKDGRVETGFKYDSDIAPVADKIDFCCQGFNLYPIDLKAEGFPDAVARACNSISIGYNRTTDKVIIAVRKGTNGKRAALTLKALGCENFGIRLDSGSSANLYVDGKAIYTTNSVLTNIIYW